MKFAKFNKIFLVVLSFIPVSFSWAQFEGQLELSPPGCQTSPNRIYKLDSELSYTSPDGFVWKTNSWSSDNVQSGTTDGASIPEWVQPIIGDSYNENYLKAAVIHDHYCYPENHVRSWRKTHRMFYDALIHLGVSKIKSLAMYYAVYLAGPKWIILVKGEKCGHMCIQQYSNSKWNNIRYFHEASLLNSEHYQKEVMNLYSELENGENFSMDDIETRAKNFEERKFFFIHGNNYIPKGSNDQNLMSRL